MIPKPVRQIGYSVIIYYIYYYTSKALGMLGVDALLGWVNEWIAMQFSNLEPSTVDVMQSIVPYVFPVLVVGILFAAFYYFDKVFEKAPPQITKTPAQSRREKDFMSLKEAARKLYMDAKRNNHPSAGDAERKSGNKPDDILVEFAKSLSKRAKIYGIRRPSNRTELISAPEVVISRFGMVDDKLILKNKHNVFTDLIISKSDLNKTIIEFQAN